MTLRLPTGGLIDRSKPLTFTFDGKPHTGYAGDTIASALLASGTRILGRSFKYHRPRGLWGAWVDEPNAIMNVTLDGHEFPNCLATTTYLQGGMAARAVNTWPSARFDMKAGLDLFHRWFAAGFYYKTFMWPDWHLFEPLIRRMAGLGAVSPDHLDTYTSDQTHDRCDTLVIGGGPAGLAAAEAAAQSGQDTLLIDDHAQLGGTAHQLPQIDATPTADWIAQRQSAIEAAGGRILTHTTAFGIYDHGLVGLAQNGPFGTAPRLIRLRAARIILATGAIDRPLTFANNDRPGIMAVAAAAEYLARYATLPGRQIALLANTPQADTLAAQLTQAGAQVTHVDPAQSPLSARGGKRLKALQAGDRTHPADTILASGGLTPLVHLWRHAGGSLAWCDRRNAFLPGTPPDNMTATGAANGSFETDEALEHARATGQNTPAKRPDPKHHITPHWPAPGSKGRQWIDFQHDVTLKDVELAARENYTSVEHLKRYTTLGMASDQGKTSNMPGLAAMAAIQGRPIPEVGTTTFRPPFVPVPIEMYHGAHTKQLWNPLKRLALEPQHRAAGAALGEYGGWLRPGWYGKGDPVQQAQTEALMARQTAAIFDASPLGKIEVMGPEAEAFVNFIYYNTIATLKPGKIRYGFMLTEGGAVFDDGVIARLDANRFVISCSSSHVDSVRTHLEAWRQDGNDPDRIFIHDTTQHWATLTVTGPRARAILDTLDLDTDDFPHMSLRETSWQDTPLRLARVSFTGDTSFELSIRASKAPALWSALLDAAKPLDAGPIGVEALSILRAEKGFLMIGKDTDGETMPHDLGFTAPRQKKSTPFVGDRSLHTDKANAPDRKQLVGLTVPAGAPPLPTGAHVVTDDEIPRSLGYVTSSYLSPTLGRPIALALLENGTDRMGDTITAWHLGETRQATVTAPCALDPEGARLDA
ncbi:2Fe-2S iron-sulfur cluster-binding protein [Roseovarius sp.]|uniref:2Fe-2S iron-sulfur cluster-binding protein n=1 Tax=Roseovarius sp. TaxID=1486281 RepID=UPI002633636D|nr:2Fe-2S iron-sulfur cluster-binding protein [Roseovarius sp.]MDM8164562.1 2Fe-2S iron-sulfur cluster-binding protein [Roseovarius sp.]